MTKRLQRTPDTAMIGGVCAGIAEYFEVDPTWIRLLAVLLIFASGFGLVAYLVAWVVVPRGPLVRSADGGAPTPAAVAHRDTAQSRGMSFVPGVILILVGMAFLFDRLFYWFRWHYVWPLVIIGAGVLLIVHSLKPVFMTSHQPAADNLEVQDASR